MEPNALANCHFDRGNYQETGFRHVEYINAASWRVCPAKEDEQLEFSARLARYCTVGH